MPEAIQEYIDELNQTDPDRQAAAAQSLATLAEEAQRALEHILAA